MSFRMEEIRELVRLIDESNITEFEVHHDSTKVMIRKNQELVVQSAQVQPAASAQAVVEPSAVQVAEPAPQPATQEDPSLHQIVSPMVGTFYRSPSPDADPYVVEGSKVKKENVVCIVEAMKLMNEIEAEVSGTIVEVLVENGQLVEYGQPLFLVKTV